MKTTHVTATAVAAKIVDAGPTDGILKVHVKNTDATNTVYVGGSDVTNANGLSILKGTEETFELGNDDELWAVCAGGLTATLEVSSNVVYST